MLDDRRAAEPVSAVAAAVWHSQLDSGTTSHAAVGGGGYALRAFSETPRAVVQPVLSEDILCLHRGGPKRVQRQQGHSQSVHDVDHGALTLMPRGQANRWRTFGPIDYVHLIPAGDLISSFTRDEFDCDRGGFEFRDDVGFRDPLIEMLFHELLRCAQRGPGERLYADTLLATLTGRLVLTRSTLPERHLGGYQRSMQAMIKGGLPGWRLRRVDEFLRDHLADDVSLGELSAIAGVSRSQLFRAFRQSTGTTPARYFAGLRIERARALVLDGIELDEVATATGFATSCGLNTAFRRHFGLTPKQFARSRK